MRVLLIDVNCKNSSTGKIVYDLYTGINARGDEAAVCYGRGPIINGKNINKFGLDWETFLHAFLTRVTGFTGCYSFFSTRRLLSCIKAFKPDVVHIHELHAYFVNIKPLLSYLAKENIPVVWTFHCEFMYTGKCGYAYECVNRKHGCGRCPSLRDYPKTLFFDHTRFMLRQKKSLLNSISNLTIVTPSQWLADRVSESFLSSREIRVIHNGIDTDIFYPRDTGALRERLHISGEEKVVLSVAPGIMSERKGGAWVLRLAEMMADVNVRFILVGADDVNIPHPKNTMIFSRTANQGELAEFYSLADVFVICSQSENFPTTCIEAQCCGTNVCGFAVGGTAETATKPYGLFAEYGDLFMLQTLINSVLFAPALHTRADCVEQAQLWYSRESMTAQYIGLYQKALTDSGSLPTE